MDISSRRLVVGAALVAVSAAGCGTEPAAPSASSSTTVPTSPAPGASGTSTPSAAADEVVRLAHAGGQVTGASARVPVRLGSTVGLEVTSDTADEVHLHGYDNSAPVAPGAPAMLTFTADIPGVFEVELEEAGVPLTQLEVS